MAKSYFFTTLACFYSQFERIYASYSDYYFLQGDHAGTPPVVLVVASLFAEHKRRQGRNARKSNETGEPFQAAFQEEGQAQGLLPACTGER